MHVHYVAGKETMDAIAKKYGFPNGDIIFYAPCNSSLRQFRSKPNDIKSGDPVYIPANTVQEAEKKVRSFRKIKADYLEMHEKMLQEWKAEYERTKSTADTVDTVKTVYDYLTLFGGIIKGGIEAMKLSGAALEEASQKLGKSAIEFGYKPVVDVAKDQLGKAVEGKGSEGLALALTKKTLHFLLVDMETPSFWTSVITGVDIKETNKSVLERFESTKAHTLEHLDEQIRKAEAELSRQKQIHNGHLNIHY